jgi:acyl carrier protein
VSTPWRCSWRRRTAIERMDNGAGAVATETVTVIRQVLAEFGKLGTEAMSIESSASLYAAGLSSHASVNVMLALEDHFDIEFPERLLKRATFESIASLHDALETVLAAT